MRLVPSVRTSGDLTGPFRAAGILFKVARNGAKTLGLSGPSLVIWETSENESFRLVDESIVPLGIRPGAFRGAGCDSELRRDADCRASNVEAQLTKVDDYCPIWREGAW